MYFPLSFIFYLRKYIPIQFDAQDIKSSTSILCKKQYLQSMPTSLNIYLACRKTALLTRSSLSLTFSTQQNAIPCNFTNTVIARHMHSPLVSRSIYLVGAEQRRSRATRHISLLVSTVLELIPAGRMNGKRNGR